jgi:hypothetical protein
VGRGQGAAEARLDEVGEVLGELRRVAKLSHILRRFLQKYAWSLALKNSKTHIFFCIGVIFNAMFKDKAH